MLEFSQFPADQVPHQELLALADDISLAVEDRRVAMLAATYSRRPEVYLRVHEVLRDPRHPGFLAVVNRMAAIGDEYSHHLLVGLDEALLDAGARVAVAAGRRTLMQKVQPDGKRKMPYVPDVARRLHLAVFARRTGHQDAAAFCTWTERYLRAQRANPAVRDRLTALATRPEKSTVPADDREAVRAWARRLLTAD
jgi:hypothetical protein